MLVDLSEDEIDLIHIAVNSRHNDLVADMIDWNVDNEEEQEKCKALKNKLDKILELEQAVIVEKEVIKNGF